MFITIENFSIIKNNICNNMDRFIQKPTFRFMNPNPVGYIQYGSFDTIFSKIKINRKRI